MFAVKFHGFMLWWIPKTKEINEIVWMNVNESALSALRTIWLGIISRWCCRGRHHHTHPRVTVASRMAFEAYVRPFSLQPFFTATFLIFDFFAFFSFFNRFFFIISLACSILFQHAAYIKLYTRVMNPILLLFHLEWQRQSLVSTSSRKKVLRPEARTRYCERKRAEKKTISVHFWPEPVS